MKGQVQKVIFDKLDQCSVGPPSQQMVSSRNFVSHNSFILLNIIDEKSSSKSNIW